MSIEGISGSNQYPMPKAGDGMSLSTGKVGGKEFGDVISDALHTVDKSQAFADSKLQDLASGKNIDIHGTMIALQEADITLRAVTSVRDKLVEAYTKIIASPL